MSKRSSLSTRSSVRSFHRIAAIDGPSPDPTATTRSSSNAGSSSSSNDLTSHSLFKSPAGSVSPSHRRKPRNIRRSKSMSNSSNTATQVAVQEALKRAKKMSSSRSSSRSSSAHSRTALRESASESLSKSAHTRTIGLQPSASLHEMELLQSGMDLQTNEYGSDTKRRNSIMNRQLDGSEESQQNATWGQSYIKPNSNGNGNGNGNGSLGQLLSYEDTGNDRHNGKNPYARAALDSSSSDNDNDNSNSNSNSNPNNSFRGSTHFSTSSSKLARRFLDEVEDDDITNGNVVEAFKDEPTTNSSSYGGSDDVSITERDDLEWNPESQRQQHHEWRKLRQAEDQHLPHDGRNRSILPRENQFPSRPDLRQVDQSVNLMTKMNNSLVDVWLDTSADNSTPMGASSSDHRFSIRRKKNTKANKRGGKRKPSHYYNKDNRSCCRDLLCSKMTIFFVFAALLGAFVAWKTGAFYKHDTDTIANGTNTTAPVDPTSNSTVPMPMPMPVPVAEHHDKEGSVMDELRALLVQLKAVHKSELWESTEPFSPQYLALHWVAQLGDDPTKVLALSNHKLEHPPENPETGDADSDSASNTLMMMTSEDCIRLVAYALAVLFYSTNGNTVFQLDQDPTESTIWHNATNWMKPVPVCQWHGVVCEENEITKSTIINQLKLDNNNLQGTLPSEVFQILFSLQNLDLSENQLSGSLPVDISLALDKDTKTTPSLEYLWLKKNRLSGTLPSSWGEMTKLQNLQIERNKLSGKLPAEINNWSNMKFLSVHNNGFTGKFPFIEGLTSLEYLYYYSNQFSEGLPYSFFRLHTLLEIRGQNNKVSGTIPPEIENLRDLKILRLEDNNIDGTIPDVFDRLTNLAELNLERNKLEGPIIPETLGSLTALELLRLDGNRLTSSIPSGISKLTSLKEFRTVDNKLEGSMPPGVCALKEDHALTFVVIDCDRVKCTCCDECP